MQHKLSTKTAGEPYGGVLFAGKNGQPNDAYNTDYTNIGPRFGFAYQLDSKTVIRGGYGIMYAVGLEGGSTVGQARLHRTRLRSTAILRRTTISPAAILFRAGILRRLAPAADC